MSGAKKIVIGQIMPVKLHLEDVQLLRSHANSQIHAHLNHIYDSGIWISDDLQVGLDCKKNPYQVTLF